MDGYTKRYTDLGNFETIKQDRVGTYQVLGTNDETFNPGMLGSHLCIFGMFQRTYSWPIVYKLKSPRLTYNVGGSQSYLEGLGYAYTREYMEGLGILDDHNIRHKKSQCQVHGRSDAGLLEP